MPAPRARSTGSPDLRPVTTGAAIASRESEQHVGAGEHEHEPGDLQRR